MKNIFYLIALLCFVAIIYIALIPGHVPTYAITLTTHKPIAQKNVNFVTLARQDAIDASIPPDLFVRQINQESGFNPAAHGGSGEIGIAQFMPATAEGLGIDPHDPVVALKAAAQLMSRYYRRYHDYAKALAAYNAGSGTVDIAVARGGTQWRAYIPTSTNDYIAAIMG